MPKATSFPNSAISKALVIAPVKATSSRMTCSAAITTSNGSSAAAKAASAIANTVFLPTGFKMIDPSLLISRGCSVTKKPMLFGINGH